jgi:hypothetical protein
MTIIIKVSILIAGIWAAIRPAVYGALFTLVFNSSAIIDFLVVGSCFVIVWHAFRPLPSFMWITPFGVLLVATIVDFLHHFRDFGESGPLPYEWLNGYHRHTLPLITLVLFNCFIQRSKKILFETKYLIEKADKY